MKIEIFLAGSTKLEEERNIVRNQIMMWNANQSLNPQNRSVEFCVYTYENFCDSISLDTGQKEYNKFIRERADVAMFILFGEINSETKTEFDIAYECLLSKRKAPEIFVFSHKASTCKKIEDIRKKLKDDGKYYIEYNSNENLKNKISPILDKYVLRRLEKIKRERVKKIKYILIPFLLVIALCLGGLYIKNSIEKEVNKLELAIEQYENSPKELEDYVKLKAAVKEYESSGLSKKMKYIKKQLNIKTL